MQLVLFYHHQHLQCGKRTIDAWYFYNLCNMKFILLHIVRKRYIEWYHVKPIAYILFFIHFHWQNFFIITELKTLSSLLYAPQKCTMLNKRTIWKWICNGSMNKIITPCEKWILSSELIFSFIFVVPTLSFATIIELKILSSLLHLWKMHHVK